VATVVVAGGTFGRRAASGLAVCGRFSREETKRVASDVAGGTFGRRAASGFAGCGVP
jgi:hypothetical protein